MAVLATYSFADVQAALTGPGGVVSIGSDAGDADEGITVSMIEEKDVLQIGAAGEGMHSLRQNKAGRVTVRILKTSATNGKLMAMLNFQQASSAAWGQNTLTITDLARGDAITCQQVAFVKAPNNSYGKDAGFLEWEFNAAVIDQLLGIGSPSLT